MDNDKPTAKIIDIPVRAELYDGFGSITCPKCSHWNEIPPLKNFVVCKRCGVEIYISKEVRKKDSELLYSLDDHMDFDFDLDDD